VVGTIGDIVLADLSKYVIFERPLDVQLSMDVRFIHDEGIFRFTYRVDGQPVLKSAITPKNGGASKSAFVALATRL
jgi:HK97 family phage major capsid protein